MTNHSDSLPDVSRETMEKLGDLVQLVEKWTSRINLVSTSSRKAIWTRHIADSAQLFDLAPTAGHNWLDLGSGGGFPGLVVAILALEKKPDLAVTLVESDQRKCAFLRTAIRELVLNARVLSTRIEDMEPQAADVISARALADLSTLLGFFARHAGADTTGLFPKGKNWQKELKDARAQWSFDVEPITSVTESEAVILKIKEVSRV